MSSTLLAFEPIAHEYRLPDGRLVPSVTHILKSVGVSTDFDEIAAMSADRAAAIERKRAIGTALHADAHAFDDNDLDLADVHPEVRPYLDAWIVFRENTRLTPVTRERRVFHAGSFYCGTLDGIFLLPDVVRKVLIDIKTGDPDDAAADLQTAGYEAAYLAEHPDEIIDERWSVRLMPDRGIPYRITNYSARPDAWLDFRKFQACCTVYHEQQARRKGSR